MGAIAERAPVGAMSYIPQARPSPDCTAPGYRLRMSKRGAEEFGTFLASFISRSGRFPDATTFARTAEISPSAVSRWINGKDRPSAANLQKIAPLIGKTPTELFAIAYPEEAAGGDTEPDVGDPLIDELTGMLDPDSPLPDAERETLRTLVDRVIEPHRRHMRSRRRSS